MKPGIGRIIDANMNRAKEGLRVTEEIARFVLNEKKLSADLKNIRHELDGIFKALPGYPGVYLAQRDIKGDVGRLQHEGEFNRRCLGDVFFANIQRVKESIRVLEEFSKLMNTLLPLRFKRLRYRLYTIETSISKKL